MLQEGIRVPLACLPVIRSHKRAWKYVSETGMAMVNLNLLLYETPLTSIGHKVFCRQLSPILTSQPNLY